MAYRTEIERALKEMISDEMGTRFQGIAVINARQKWPELVACERKWDGGLDAYATGKLRPDGAGIGLASSTTGTIKKIKEDAEEVKKHYPDVQVLIFATPVKVSQHTKDLWAKEISDKSGLRLEVVSREEFITWLLDPANADICRHQLGIAPSMSQDLEPALERSRQAAMEVAEDWDRAFRKPGRPVISLNAVKLDIQGHPLEAVQTVSMNALITEGQRIILESPAGGGKTTTLVQVAKQALAAGRVALLVDLPEWVRSRKTLLPFVAEYPQFASRDVDATVLAKLRGPQPLIFLLNGWNEVPVAGVEAADAALRGLERDFPAATIVVATRVHRLIPKMRGAFRLALNSLGRAQRDKYLDLALGESAHDLRAKLDKSRVLDSITRTPLFLAEVVDLYRSGKDIPPTKMGVLGAVMDMIEQSPGHRTSLQQAPLRGHAAEYLCTLSMEMTERGETKILEAEGRAVVTSVNLLLQTTGQIVEEPDPGDVLDELSKHHALVRTTHDGVSFQFQHQQFQEFFAAGALKARLLDLVHRKDSDENRKFLTSYVNEPVWGEPLRMLAEKIGASGRESGTVEIGTELVRMALEVDPLFAGELARRCGPLVWNEVGKEMGARLRAWYAVKDRNHKQCALAAMLATGLDDFKDIIVPLLSDPRNDVRLGAYWSKVELSPSSLGPNWMEEVHGWPEEARVDLILKLAHDPWLTETVEQFALADPSPKVKWNAARQLSWYGFTEKVEKLLGPLPDEDFRNALHSLALDEIPLALRPRAIEVYETEYAESGDALDRLRTLYILQGFGAKEIDVRIQANLEALDERQLTSGNEGLINWAMEELRISDPQWMSDWVARKVMAGSTRLGGRSDTVVSLPKDDRERLLTLFTESLLEPSEQRRVLSLLAVAADEELAARVFETACEILRGLSDAPGRDIPRWNLLRQQEDLLRAIAPRILLGGLSRKLEADPETTELRVLTEVLPTLSPATNDDRKTVSNDMREKLHGYLKRAVGQAADPNGMRASVRARLAVLLAQAGGPSDTPDLRRLIHADLVRLREMWAARLKGDRSGDIVSYVYLYIDAVTTADPERADDLLLELLGEAEYERVTAETLVRRAMKGNGPPVMEHNRLDFRRIWAAREGQETEEFDEKRRSRYADAIRAVVERLLKEREAATDKRTLDYRLKQVGSALAALDARRSAKLVLELTGFPGSHDGYTRVASLESLVSAGVKLTFAEMMNVLDPTIGELRRDHANNDQHRWLLRRCLSLLAFADPPADGIAKIREILTGIRFPPFELGGLVAALGASRYAEAMDLLIELAKPDGSGAEAIGEPWIRAVAQLGGERSNGVLISFVDPNAKLFTKEFLPDDQHGDLLAALLAARAAENAEFKAELFRLANGGLLPIKRTLLAKTFAHFQAEDELLAGLCVLRDDGSGVPYEILRSVENQFVERRPYGTQGIVFTLEPRASNALRRRLFEMAQTDPVRKHSAYALLGQIEVWRLEYGRPPNEPRHPAVESGVPWPPFP